MRVQSRSWRKQTVVHTLAKRWRIYACIRVNSPSSRSWISLTMRTPRNISPWLGIHWVRIQAWRQRMRSTNGRRASRSIKRRSRHQRRSIVNLGRTGRWRNAKKLLEEVIDSRRTLVKRISESASFSTTIRNTSSRWKNWWTAKLFLLQIPKYIHNSNRKFSCIKQSVFTNYQTCPAKTSKKEFNISKSSRTYKPRIWSGRRMEIKFRNSKSICWEANSMILADNTQMPKSLLKGPFLYIRQKSKRSHRATTKTSSWAICNFDMVGHWSGARNQLIAASKSSKWLMTILKIILISKSKSLRFCSKKRLIRSPRRHMSNRLWKSDQKILRHYLSMERYSSRIKMKILRSRACWRPSRYWRPETWHQSQNQAYISTWVWPTNKREITNYLYSTSKSA